MILPFKGLLVYQDAGNARYLIGCNSPTNQLFKQAKHSNDATVSYQVGRLPRKELRKHILQAHIERLSQAA